MEKGDQDHLNYHPPSGIPADWRFGNTQPPPPQSLAMMPSNAMPGGSSACPSASMVDSYCATLWDHPPPNSQGLGFPEPTNAPPIRPPALDSSRLEMGAAGMYLQSGGGGILPHPGLPQFSADSAFIERAARFSCLGGTSFGALMSPFGMTQPLDGYSTGLKMMLGAPRPQHEAVSVGETSKDVVGMSVDRGSPNGGSPMSSQKDAGAHSTPIAGDDSGDAELNGNGLGENLNLDNVAADQSSKGLAAKKRKRNGQEMEIDETKGEAETSKEGAEGKNGVEENISTLAIKSDGKNGKTATDPPKEDYVHVRARRGQATNSHSLAERVRREKISERMKFLQDLVPGCSKVTGKAVMLDEIINYVQSLQRQVELLSMKLAAVNPHLDYNIEGLLSKDLLQQRPGPSSAIGFSPDMPHPLLHQSQAFIHPGIPGMGADAPRRSVGAQMTTINTYKEAKQQIPNAWESEFQSVFQMGYGTNPPMDIQDLNGSLPHPTNDS